MVVMGDTMRQAAEVHTDRADTATAWWTTGPGTGEFREEALPSLGSGEATVRTLWTGISRGTEALVARGAVPLSEHERMRAPFQAGELPFPVKYGYLNVGVVEAGPAALRGRAVFALFPHQSRFVVPADALVPLPDGVPARRAVLAGAVETAVNVLWDAAPALGDRILIFGAGMIGCALARLAVGIPGAVVVVTDVDPAKRDVVEALGARFADDGEPFGAADIVVEASGCGAALPAALRAAPTDGEVIVASWYGDRPVPLELGADFHARRLSIRSSQVGAVGRHRRSRHSTQDRLTLALRLLEDPAFDRLLAGSSAWQRLPKLVAALADGSADPLCHTVQWSVR